MSFNKSPEQIAQLLTEDFEPLPPRKGRSWPINLEFEIEEYQDKAVFGNNMASISFDVGASVSPGEEDTELTPGTGPDVNWEITGIQGVTVYSDTNGADVDLTPEVEEVIKNSLAEYYERRGTMEEKVLEKYDPYDQPDH